MAVVGLLVRIGKRSLIMRLMECAPGKYVVHIGVILLGLGSSGGLGLYLVFRILLFKRGSGYPL